MGKNLRNKPPPLKTMVNDGKMVEKKMEKRGEWGLRLVYANVQGFLLLDQALMRAFSDRWGLQLRGHGRSVAGKPVRRLHRRDARDDTIHYLEDYC